MTKVLILHTSMGHGIKTTAFAVAEKLQANGNFEVRILDVQKAEAGRFVTALKKIYLFFTESQPWIWGVLYNSKFVLYLALAVRGIFAPGNSSGVLNAIKEFAPDVVVSTQAGPSGIVSYLKKKGLYQGKLVIVFSDYHLHRFWLFKNCDLYVCSTRDQQIELLKLGVPEKRAVLTGMNIAAKYFEKTDKKEARKRLGLAEGVRTVLLAGGARGLLSSCEIVKNLFQSKKSLQVVVVAGKNKELREDLHKLAVPVGHVLKIVGYVDNFEEFLSAADVVITKPGGPTIAEAAAKGLGIVLTDAHPGHEAANKDWLVKNSIALYLGDPKEAINLLETAKGLASELILRPQGSRDLAEAVGKISN